MLENGKIRLVDIAREAGVSVAAVSKILGNNNCNSIGVRKEKAEAIRKIAAKYSYAPNLHARALVGQSTRLVGVLVDSRQPPVMSRMLAEMEHHVAQNGYRMMIAEAHENIETLYENYKTLKQHGVDGVIFMSHEYEGQTERFCELFRHESNIVYLGVPHIDRPFSCVDIAYADGIIQAVEHLRRQRRKKIALILTSPRCIGSIQARINGYEFAVPKDEQLEFTLTAADTAGLRDAMGRLLDEEILPRGIDALLMQNDLQALMVLGLLADRGIRVPEQMAVIGHDNEPFSEYMRPELTTIDLNIGAAAAALVDALLKAISDERELSGNRIFCTKPELVLRHTT